MGYKDDIEIKHNFDEAATGEFGNFNDYLAKIEEIFGSGMDFNNLEDAVRLIAQNEYISQILEDKSILAKAYEDVVCNLSPLSNQNKSKVIDVMNLFFNFINLVHENSNPISSRTVIDLLIEEDSTKRFYKRDGTEYLLENDGYVTLTKYNKKGQIALKCGDVTIVVSPNIIDMQFGEKEGIIISKSSEKCSSYVLPKNRDELYYSGEYELKQEWYNHDLTEEICNNCDEMGKTILSAITKIDDKALKGKVFQDSNYLLTKARLDIVIPYLHKTKNKLQMIKNGLEEYHSLHREKIEKIVQENLELRIKTEILKVDEILKENEDLRRQNGELIGKNIDLQETIQTERSIWRKIPVIGNIIAKRVEKTKKKSLPNGSAPSDNLPDTLEQLKVNGIDYSQSKFENRDIEIEPKIK